MEKSVVKVTKRLIPFLLLMYVLAFLDRANVGFAKQAFQVDTHLTDAMFAFGAENITNQAFWLAYAEMFADYAWFTSYLEKLAAVTPADVQRVAQTWFRTKSRVVGIYLPVADGGDE